MYIPRNNSIENDVEIQLFVKDGEEFIEELIIVKASATISCSIENADADGNRGIPMEFVEDIDFEYPERFESHLKNKLGRPFDKNESFYTEFGEPIDLHNHIMGILKRRTWEYDLSGSDPTKDDMY